MAIWGCGSPACAVSLLMLEALFLQISGVSLALTCPLRLCLLRVLLGTTATATSFPLSKHTGGGETIPAFSGLRVYLQFTWVMGLSPLLWSFPLTTTFTSFPTPGCWACGFSSQLVVRDFPSPPLRCSGHPVLFAMCLFCCYCLLFSFFFLFSLGGGQSVQGAMVIWPSIVCRNTMCHLAHLVVCVFPCHLGIAVLWRCGGPPGFSIWREVEMLCPGWRCGGLKDLPLLGVFSCKVYFQYLSKILL
jgi:hypothetical protein